ncbi:unnamed protein product [Vitrella brassicaformis CCMP3155]|uniref:MYND-type domain-containing protein n=2 Tax=Vitrella brassicaformis TaxID=1169539 RepID=A0A0G4FED3_VITBC|nr:unnamed protein product [Vitrella brassicaformis CCMP3155]|eukprot:CEM11573.1 unnamed protein product [Vitrella brassicaformis CCMP3155]
MSHFVTPDEPPSAFHVEVRPSLGGRVLCASRDLDEGEVIIFEEAFLSCTGGTAEALACVEELKRDQPGRYELFRRQFLAHDMAAEYGQKAKPQSLADEYMSSREGSEEDGGLLSREEVVDAITIWDMNTYITSDSNDTHALFDNISKIPHSCSPCVSVIPDKDKARVRVYRAVKAGEILGSWYPEDVVVFWMDSIARRRHIQQERGFLCNCDRCVRAPDTCRLLPCPDSNLCDGTVIFSPSPAPSWRCNECGHSFSNDDPPEQLAAALASESSLRERVLAIHSDRLQHGRLPSCDELAELSDDIVEALGTDHWLFGYINALLSEYYQSARATSNDPGEQSLAAAYGLAHLDWIRQQLDRWGLARAPGYVMRPVFERGLFCCEWYRDAVEAFVNDRTVLLLRLTRFMLTLTEDSCWNDQGRHVLDTMRAYVNDTESRCHRCHADMGQPSTGSADADRSASDDGWCGVCLTVRYCSDGCRKADWECHSAVCCDPATPFLDMADELMTDRHTDEADV